MSSADVAAGSRDNALKVKSFARSNTAIRRLGPALRVFGVHARKELFFQTLFYHAAAAAGLTLPVLYPVQSAATYSLLYAILRAVTDLPVRSVLDIGAGESTLLLNALAQRDPGLRITTLETDRSWAERVGSKVRHAIHHVPLERKLINGRETMGYADLGVLAGQRFDLVLVDGPPGAKRNSRWAALEVLSKCLGEEFLVIFDDAERQGETDTILEFVQHTSGVNCHSIRSIKSQFLVFTPRFGSAGHF